MYRHEDVPARGFGLLIDARHRQNLALSIAHGQVGEVIDHSPNCLLCAATWVASGVGRCLKDVKPNPPMRRVMLERAAGFHFLNAVQQGLLDLDKVQPPIAFDGWRLPHSAPHALMNGVFALFDERLTVSGDDHSVMMHRLRFGALLGWRNLLLHPPPLRFAPL